MKAYLDNNIVSAIAKDDHPADSEALDRFLKAKDEGKVDLVTSELTLEEIKKYQGPMQPRVERIFPRPARNPRSIRLFGLVMPARRFPPPWSAKEDRRLLHRPSNGARLRRGGAGAALSGCSRATRRVA